MSPYETTRSGSIKLIGKLGKLQLVRPTPGLTPSRGFLRLGTGHVPCVLGPAGAVWRKKEGDTATPRGTFSLLFGLYRADRLRKPASRQMLTPTKRNDVWCDDQASFQYNRPGRAPVQYGHERLWLNGSGAYDIVVILDHNRRPRRLGGGSAIFLHLTLDFSPTAGCIAVSLPDMRKILFRISRNSRLSV